MYTSSGTRTTNNKSQRSGVPISPLNDTVQILHKYIFHILLLLNTYMSAQVSLQVHTYIWHSAVLATSTTVAGIQVFTNRNWYSLIIYTICMARPAWNKWVKMRGNDAVFSINYRTKSLTALKLRRTIQIVIIDMYSQLLSSVNVRLYKLLQKT